MAAKNTDEFVTEIGGVTVKLPLLSNMKTGLVRKIRKLEAGDQVFTIIEEVCSEAELAAIDELSQPELAQLMEDWQAASGIEMGESSAS